MAATSHNNRPLSDSQQYYSDTYAFNDRLCPGCNTSAISDNDGLVVAFGQSFFHVACFKCAKCGNQVTADTNLLLLTDGSPICANCSYLCNVCQNPILDEAIMAGDDSYHAHCFNCRVCKNRIDELKFAKTSQGIYCMSCHDERVEKIRRYNERKAERERNGGSGNMRSRDREARNHHQELSRHIQPGKDSLSRPSSSRSQGNLSANTNTPQDASRPSTARSTDGSMYARPPIKPRGPPLVPNGQPPQPNGTSLPLHQPSVNVAPPKELDRTNPVKSNNLPVPPLHINGDSDGRRRNYDDGVRPLNVLLSQKLGSDPSGIRPDTAPSKSEGLTVISRQEKRRSINPGLVLPNIAAALSGNVNATLSPQSASFPDQRSQSVTPPPTNTQSSRPISQSSSYYSFPTPAEAGLARSRSPSINITDIEDHTIVLKPTSRSRLQELQPGSQSPINNTHRLSVTSNLTLEDRGSTVSSRSNSPLHQVDVPRGIEDGSDSDNASPSLGRGDSVPPSPPPKDGHDQVDIPIASLGDEPGISQQEQDLSDDMSESSPVQKTSHTTFIAHALPPIRFSLNDNDFSKLAQGDLTEFLNPAQGAPAMKSLDRVTTLLNDVNGSPIPPKATVDTTAATATPSIPDKDQQNSEGNKYVTDKETPHITNQINTPTRITITEPDTQQPTSSEADTVLDRLREVLKQLHEQSPNQVQLDVEFVEVVIARLESQEAACTELKDKFDGMKRKSQHFIDGLTVAQTEYDKELKARREAEAEVTRLRVLLSGQAAKLTALSGDDRRQELRQQMSKELNDSLSGLEHHLSRLKLERDITLAEVEELSSTKSTSTEKPQQLGRSFTKRMDTLKKQYQRDLIPLTEQREILSREIAELKAIRDMFLEETTALNARNEELAQLSHIYSRRLEAIPETPIKQGPNMPIPRNSSERGRSGPNIQVHSIAIAPSLSMSTSSSSTMTIQEEGERLMKPPRHDNEIHNTPRKFKWPGTRARDATSSINSIQSMQSLVESTSTKSRGNLEHNFQQLSVLRITRCDNCSDTLWGSQLRCTVCNISIHVRCIAGVQISCTQQHRESQPVLPPSMFSRNLIEQVQSDDRGDGRQVPVIVEKCIAAVEATALEYEGIYRKTGGSGQSKLITHLFERGDYTFDLLDSDKFNDICSVTSVLKTYFRSLPNPLLTYELYDQFVQAVTIKDQALKNKSLSDLVLQLPSEHYYTLRLLMLHLHRVHERNEKNLMTGRNLGVVFGPTLIRSRDPSAEFGHMAERALFVQWLIENAPQLFNGTSP